MKQLNVLVLWAACVGLSMQQMYAATTPAMPSSDPCDNYYLLSQRERNLDYILTVDAPNTICDTFRFDEDAGEWYRFDNKVTGGRLPEFCVSTVSEFKCGTHVPIWMNGSHPTEAFPGPKTVRVCGNKYISDQDPDDCCGWSAQIQVKYCPAKSPTEYPYYVYKLKNPPQCESAYCTTEACEPGYTRNMTDHCVDIDECASDLCWYGSMCINTEGSFTCISDGSESTTVPYVNNCDEMPCINGYCTNYYYYSFEPYCVCNYGFTGVYCETVLPCSDNPCGPGECHEIDDGTYECTCPRGVYGRNCSEVDCGYDPCEIGECISAFTDRHFCQCFNGYEGVLCERSTYVTTTVSTSQPCTCYNEGTCVYNDYSDDYYCDCPMGYTGLKCETALDCNSPGVTCQNGGSCWFIYGYSCHCPLGTSGDFCQFRTGYTTTSPTGWDPCHNARCAYGSTCLPEMWTGDYTCLCGPGYTGYHCDEPTDCYCVHGDCVVSGYNEFSRYSCACHAGYTGQACDIQMTSCYQDPCHNDGVCKDYNTNFLCTCPYNFAGLYCEEENGKPGIDIEIDTDDASMIIENGQYMPEVVAHIINLYCMSNLEECCNSFGYSNNQRVTDMALVTADQCYMNYVEFDWTSFVIRIRAYTTVDVLSQLCLVSDFDNDMEYLTPYLLQSIVENNIDQIESATGVDILSVEHSALSQDEDFVDEAVRHSGHSKALVIGLSVTLSILGLIVFGGVIIVVCIKCKQPKRNRQLASTPQPVPTVTRPQFMYQQPTTPHDLFLASGTNGMPPAYQEVVKYPASPPPSYDAHIQNQLYGGTPQTKNNVLPPMNAPVDGGEKKPEGGQLDTVTNPVPPSDTVYHFQAPRVQPAGRLPPIQHTDA